jgi:Na+/H+ antiporter NhaC
LDVKANGQAISFLSIIENLDLGISLFYGALISTLVAWVVAFIHQVTIKESIQASKEGIHSMLGAVVVLLFAWMMADLITDLNTGKYLSNFALANVGTWLLPLLMFFLTGVISFSTGSSWGTFGIMIPICMDMVFHGSSDLMYPLLAAVLSGAVFGDHCSPISDTTILSSTGAGCHHIDHVMTQLPYALIAAAISTIGFIVLGVFQSLSLAVVLVLCLLALLIYLLLKIKQK